MASIAWRRRRAPLEARWQGIVLSRPGRKVDGCRRKDRRRVRSGFPDRGVFDPSPATDFRHGFLFLRRDPGWTEISGQHESGRVQFGAFVCHPELVLGDGEIASYGSQEDEQPAFLPAIAISALRAWALWSQALYFPEPAVIVSLRTVSFSIRSSRIRYPVPGSSLTAMVPCALTSTSGSMMSSFQ